MKFEPKEVMQYHYKEKHDIEGIKLLFGVYEEKYLILCEEVYDIISSHNPLKKYKSKLEDSQIEVLKEKIAKKKEIMFLVKSKIELLVKDLNPYFLSGVLVRDIQNVIKCLDDQLNFLEKNELYEFQKNLMREQVLEEFMQKELLYLVEKREEYKYHEFLKLQKYSVPGSSAVSLSFLIINILLTYEQNKLEEKKVVKTNNITNKLDEEFSKIANAKSEDKFELLKNTILKLLETQIELTVNLKKDYDKNELLLDAELFEQKVNVFEKAYEGLYKEEFELFYKKVDDLKQHIKKLN